jgi:transcriptional regulator with XRE-family HTH domain
MTLNQTLGATVQAARKARGWTQTELAEQSGVHLNTVSAVERGQADPRLSSVSALLAPLGLQLGVQFALHPDALAQGARPVSLKAVEAAGAAKAVGAALAPPLSAAGAVRAPKSVTTSAPKLSPSRTRHARPAHSIPSLNTNSSTSQNTHTTRDDFDMPAFLRASTD